MDFKEAVRNRRSIRWFLPKPVSDKIIEEIIEKALWAQSWGNTQPWELVVATSPKLERFKKENSDAFLAGKTPQPDIPMTNKWSEKHKNRYNDLGESIMNSLSIDKDNQEGRIEHFEQMFSVYDAPVLVLITIDKALSLPYAMLDVGAFTQTFCLLAHSMGLGACAMAASVHYPDILRKHLSISDTKLIVIGIALGWPDLNNPVNKYKRKRADLAETVRWVA